jgi:hypothetical protein
MFVGIVDAVDVAQRRARCRPAAIYTDSNRSKTYLIG